MLNILDILEIIKDLIIVIAPMIFSYFMYVKTKKHGEIAKKEDEQHNLLKEKLNKVYFPIYLKHITELGMRENYVVLYYDDVNSNHYFDTLHFVDDILYKNLNYLPTETQKLFIDFHVNLLNSCTYGLEQIDVKNLHEDKVSEAIFNALDAAYENLYSILIKEYEDICNKLDLPTPIK